MKLTPLHNNLVIEEHNLPRYTKSGFLIPDRANDSKPYRYGKVLAVGPGRRALDGALVPVQAAVGDVVAYSKNRGVEFPLDDENGDEKVYKMVNEQDILGIVTELPQVSSITGLDGKLMMMNPASRAPSDGAVEQLDRVARARHEGIIDSAGGTLAAMEMMDVADVEVES